MRIWKGNAVEGLPWADGSVDVIVTSPPYWGLRAYGDSDDELGREDREKYLERLQFVMRECHRVLADDGVLWLNIGDTASKSGGAGGDYNKGGSKEAKPKWKQGESGYPPMTWCNVPGTITDRMLADGWLLRSTIIWNKEVQRAEDLKHIRRVRPQHEFIFMFAKTTKYHFFHEGLEETGSVWTFRPESSGKKGQAPFPDELVRRCVSCSAEPGMIVADPFAGSGTTPRVAEEMGMVGWGLDLYADWFVDGVVDGVTDVTEADAILS